MNDIELTKLDNDRVFSREEKIILWRWSNKKCNICDKNIVVEINRTVISKMYWDDTRIEENDKIEIITAVGGG